MKNSLSLSLSLSLSFVLSLADPASAQVAGPPQALLDQLRSGQSVELMIEFDAESVRRQATRMSEAAGRARLGPSELAYKRAEYAAMKGGALAGLAGVVVLQQYENLAVSFARVDSEEALHALLARTNVKAVHENTRIPLQLAETLPFINQEAVAAAEVGGAGATVGVLDTGVDYFHSDFGCTAPGVPAACRVVDTLEAAADDSSLDDNGHGSNVSGIAAGVAPQAKLAVADVFFFDTFFQKHFTNPSLVASGINWLISIRDTYHIVVVNLSIGDGSANPSTCSASLFNGTLQDAINAGIQPVVSSGNTAFLSGVFRDGLSDPGCVPGVVSVGAVYDDDIGGVNWGPCTDATTVGDQVACFSQTASYLSLLAPGIQVTAGGQSNFTGTSMAAPHVAGAWAVLTSAMPNATQAEILSTLQTRGVLDSDPRVPGRTTRRLELFSALDSDSDSVLFPLDNCSALANTNQVNADGDACGNRCDGDFDDSSFTSIGDFTTFKACYTRQLPVGAPGGPANDPNCLESDMDGTGAMSIGDFTDFKIEYTSGGGFPGPSGLPSAAPGTACAP